MKRLEDIPKKNPFEVPDGYFEQLPAIIQARVTRQLPSAKYGFRVLALRYALPVLLIVGVAVVWHLKKGDTASLDPEEMLASIDTPALVAYLESTDVTTDELLESIYLSQDDVEQIENQIYEIPFEEGDLEDLMDEYIFEMNN